MSLSELSINIAQLKDLPQIVELDQLCFGGLWNLEGYQRELESPNSTLLILSIPATGKIIGCGCFWAILEEAHITILAIHPNFRGKGLGKLLLYNLLKDAVKRNLERATLEVSVSNGVALSVYEKFGFKIAGKRKGYYEKTGEDALILWRGDLAKPEFFNDLKIWQQQIDNNLLLQGFKYINIDEDL